MNIASKLLLWIAGVFLVAIVLLIALPANAVPIDDSPDCDKYAVMYCGAKNKAQILDKLRDGDGQHSAANIKDIYAQFGLKPSEIENATFEDGTVFKNGEVKIGNKVVATNAKTYIRTMGKVDTSQMGSAQAAKVAVDKNGMFLFAIMTPCGNPVTAKAVKPEPQHISCDALNVQIIDKKNRVVKATVSGSAKNTKIDDYKINFGDGTVVEKASAEHTYKTDGTFKVIAHVIGKVDGDVKSRSSDACVKDISFVTPVALNCTALTINTINAQSKTVKVTVQGVAENTPITGYEIDFGDGTIVNQQSAEHTYKTSGTYKITGHVAGNGTEVTSPECAKEVMFPDDGKLACSALNIQILDKKNRIIKASVVGSAGNNVKITGYKIDFGDGTTVNKETSEHTYKKAGTYKVVAHVIGDVNGKETTVTSDGCKQDITFISVTEGITCESLTINAINREKRYVKVTVKGLAENTTINSYKIDFGDGKTANTATAEHTYADYGSYTIVATVGGMVSGEQRYDSNINCEQKIAFSKTPEACPTNPNIPKDDPRCKPCPTNPNLAYDDPACTTKPLPNTGAGSVLGIAGGVTVLGALGHRLWITRRGF